MSLATARTWATMISGGIGWTAVTPTVFCAVIAVIAVMPCTPQAANALRSAWMPAPPPESEPAIERTRGTRRDVDTSTRVVRCAARTIPSAGYGDTVNRPPARRRTIPSAGYGDTVNRPPAPRHTIPSAGYGDTVNRPPAPRRT